MFLALWRSNVDMELAGWVGAALAAMVLVGFRVFRLRYNPILLGINVDLLVTTPLIVAVFHLGAHELGQTLVAYAHRGVFVAIFLVGCFLTIFSRHGFVGVEGLPASSRWIYSSILLAASVAAIAWSFNYSGGALLGIAVPIMALFGLRRLLIARWFDNNQMGGIAAAAGGAALATDFGSDTR